MSGIEYLLSMVVMIFILGVFVSFVVLMGTFSAQENAKRRRKERRARRRASHPET